MPFDAPFACPDWEEKLARGETPIAELPLDEEMARKAVALFNSLQLPDVTGYPPLAEAAGEWFRDIVRNAFAAIDPETGRKLVNEIFALVPKKNSKTTYSAALGLTALLMWERPNAQLLILGPTQNVADRCFDQARGMIEANPRLAKIFHVQPHLKTITRRKTGATLKVKTFDLNVVTGEIPALTIIDELHIIAAKSYARRVIEQIRGGMVTNPDALLVFITTQSDVPPVGAFEAELQYARGVRDGRITKGVRTLPVLYEFSEDMQRDEAKPWRDPKNWPLVLPNLGLSVQMDILLDQYHQAIEKGPEAERGWASQHLNVQIGMALHYDRWPGADFWEENREERLDLAQLIDRSEVAVAGVDVGGADDLFALTVIGRESESRNWLCWTRAWCAETVLSRRKEIASRLRDFERAGDLVITGDTRAHVTEAADICDILRDAALLPDEAAIGVDPWGVAGFRDEMFARDFTDDQVTLVSQGYRLSGAIKGLERRLVDGGLKHGDQGLLNWCVGNAKAETRGNNVYITKEKAGTSKIDPLVALFNAAILMDLNPSVAGTSYLDHSELMVV